MSPGCVKTQNILSQWEFVPKYACSCIKIVKTKPTLNKLFANNNLLLPLSKMTFSFHTACLNSRPFLCEAFLLRVDRFLPSKLFQCIHSRYPFNALLTGKMRAQASSFSSAAPC